MTSCVQGPQGVNFFCVTRGNADFLLRGHPLSAAEPTITSVSTPVVLGFRKLGLQVNLLYSKNRPRFDENVVISA